MTDTIKHMLRAMAWERAKGELLSILTTYVDEEEQYASMELAMEVFIERVEENGWHK